MSAVSPVQFTVIRTLTPADLDEVVAIERACYPFPWTRGIFADCLRVGYSCFGLQLGDRLAGYSVHSWAAGEAHLLNLCIDSAFQNRGFGRLLLDHAVRHAQALDCEVMFLEVRPSNLRAGQLYERAGFEVVGERPAYYPALGGREDAVVMGLDLLGDNLPRR